MSIMTDQTQQQAIDLLTTFIKGFFNSCEEYSHDEMIDAIYDEEMKEALIDLIASLPTKTGKTKTKTISNKPTKTRTAYYYFCKENRQDVKNKNPDKNSSTILIEEWNAIKDNPKKNKKYSKMALDDKDRYEKEMEDFTQDPDFVPDKKKLKDPNAPKRAMTSYMAFTKEKRSSMSSGDDQKNIMVKIGQMWRETKDRTKFERMAEKDKKRYIEEMKSYDRPNDEDLEKLSLNKKKRKTPKYKDPDAPKSALSGYMHFNKANTEALKKKNPDINQKELISKLGALWTSNKKDNTETYKDFMQIAADDKERYIEEMKIWDPSNEKVSAKKKTVRKPNAKTSAKKQPTGFILYNMQNRDDIQKENPEMNAAELSSEVSKQWKSLSVKEKAKYSE
jgi:hypothetical protein